MRMSDNHDEARAVARFSVKGALAASALMFTLDGVPLLYNGMEVGDATESGDPALFEKLPIFWAPKERPALRKIYHSLIQLRRQYPALQSQEVVWLHNSDEADVVSYLRADATDKLLVVINFSNRPVTGKLELADAPQFSRVKIDGLSEGPEDSLSQLKLKGFEWRIYHRSVK